MSDELPEDQPFTAWNKRPAPPRTPVPGLEIWRLRMKEREIRCELRDDERACAGFDVQLIESQELRVSRRCVNMTGARFVAESYRRDLLRTGWKE